MHYCDSCTEKPVRRKITPEMAKLLKMDPKSRVCPECFEDLTTKVKALR